MERKAETKNGQEIIRFTHTGPRKNFWYMDEHDNIVKEESNPGARELLLFYIRGRPEKDLNHRFVVAVGIKDRFERLPISYESRTAAEYAAVALSNCFEHVLVLDTNYDVPVFKTAEDDPEEYDRRYENEGRFRTHHPEENPY